jgi:hypothetical protein
VVFVCSHNDGRSQVAAALLQHRAGERVTVSSAGTAPACEVEPEVALVLTEAGIALEAAYPRPLTDEVVQAADIGGDHGLRRRLPGGPRSPLPGLARRRPRRAPIAVVRAIRDAIDAYVTDLLASLPAA